VRIQPAQAGFGRAQHVVVAEVVRGDFGGNEHPLTDALDCSAYRVLGAVHFRRVDEERPQFDAPAQGFHTATVSPDTQPDLRHHHAGVAQLFQFHV
jgi:hypothetical protein